MIRGNWVDTVTHDQRRLRERGQSDHLPGEELGRTVCARVNVGFRTADYEIFLR